MIPVAPLEDLRKCDKETSALQGEINLIKEAANLLFNNNSFTGKILVVTGNGNNGADGLALALLLKENNYDVDIYRTRGNKSQANEYFFKLIEENNIKQISLNDDFNAYDVIVDGLLGIGFHPPLKEEIFNVINKINASSAKVISIDINSGLNGANGLGDLVVKSDLTCSLSYYKPGHFLNMADDVMKQKINLETSIKLNSKPYYLLIDDDIRQFIGKRHHYSNKGNYGYLSLIGGSDNYQGAIKLCNMAASALRSGAGVIKLAAPKDLKEAILPHLLEATFFPLSEIDGHLLFNQQEITSLLTNSPVCVCGMGLTNNHETQKLVSFLLENYTGTLLLDADALNALANLNKSIILNKKCQLIITPHIKEFSRLSSLTIDEILSSPCEVAKEFAKKYHIILVLKSNTTIITDGENLYLSNKGCPGMAVGGSGDVLSGIIGALVSQKRNNILMAAAAGCYINGLAGELAEKDINELSHLPSDTINYLIAALNKLLF